MFYSQKIFDKMTNKEKEYIGDALILLLAREYWINNRGDVHIHVAMNRAQMMGSNEKMGLIGEDLGLLTKEHLRGFKSGGTEMEEILGEMYITKGYDFCKNWFESECIPAYYRVTNAKTIIKKIPHL